MNAAGGTTVASYLIDRLTEIGVEHIFAVPGDYASAFLLTVDATDGITRVPTITELGAGYAADGYGRVRGIGAACVQYGVGTFSALNCTAGAYVERVPLVLISASPTHADRQLERRKGILFHHSTGDLRADQHVYANVTVASEIVENPADAPAQIDRAITRLLTERRPIYIEVLQDVWTLACPAPTGTLRPDPPSGDPESLAAALAAAWTRIQAAERPVLWAGIEIARFGLQDELQRIVEVSGIPFTTTSLAKTVLDEAQPLFAGTYAGPASRSSTNDLMTNSDCVVALGTIITDDYLDIMGSSFGRMVEVTTEETRVGDTYYHGVPLAGFLSGLLAKFQADRRYPRSVAAPVVAADALLAPIPEAAVTYTSFFQELATYLQLPAQRDHTVLVLGESTSLYVAGNLWNLPPNAFVAQAAWGSLGHETGCALGVAIGSGKRPIVVAGDGGFMMTCQELSSLARQRSNAVVFVMSNQAYAIEQAFVDIHAFQPDGQFAPFDLLPSWDYLALAQAFGVKGFRVETIAQLRAALTATADLADVPALIQVCIPQKDLAPQLARLAAAPPPARKYRGPSPTG